MTPPGDQIPTGFKRWAIVIAGVLGTAVFDLTWMIVGVALPHMQGSFSATPDQIAWVMTAFIVGGTMMVAVTGWASTRFGRKQVFVLAIAGNTLATVMCGASESLEAEVFWRFMQGVLSAPLLALGQALTIDAFPPEKRGLAAGIWGAAGVGAVVFAPVLGGYLIEHMNWRWVFYAVIPLGLFATIWSFIFIPSTPPQDSRRLDWSGFAALIVLVGALQLALSRGERLDWLASPEIRIELLVACFALLVLLVRLYESTTPIIERQLFVDRNYSVSVSFMLLFGGLTTLPIILIPLMLQQMSGYPAITAGAMMFSRGLGTVVSLLGVGFLMSRLDPRLVLAVGFGFFATTNIFMSTWNASINVTALVVTNFVQGCASGATYVPIVTLSLATLAKRLHTEGITFMFLVFNMGSALGVAAVFALHTRLIQINRSVLVEHVTETNELLRTPSAPVEWDLQTQSGLASVSAEVSRQAQMIAYVDSYLAIGIAAALVIPLIALIKKPISSKP